MTDLTLIIVTHNGREMALRTIQSAGTALGGLSAEFLIVDSGSLDGTPDAIEKAYPDVRLWRRPNIGFAAANNVALEHAKGRYVLLLNPDVVVLEGSFEDLVATMDARPGVGLASVIQVLPDGRVHETIRRFPGPLTKLGEAVGAQRLPFTRRLREFETRQSEYVRERDADWVVGAFMIARRDAIAAVGPFDERFFLYSEETDWCRRFRDAGWAIRHLPVMRVMHFGASRSRPELPRATEPCQGSLCRQTPEPFEAGVGTPGADAAASSALSGVRAIHARQARASSKSQRRSSSFQRLRRLACSPFCAKLV